MKILLAEEQDRFQSSNYDSKMSMDVFRKFIQTLNNGLGKGAIEAVQKWDKPWEGIKKESKYAIKAVW